MTPTHHSMVFLGDLLGALRRLAVTGDRDRRAVAELLGFSWRAARPSESAVSSRPSPAARTTPELVRRPPVSEEQRGQSRQVETDADADIERDGALAEAIPSTLTAAGVERPTWSPQVTALPAGPSEEALIELPFEPLLQPGWTRAILAASLAIDGGDGEIDVERTVEHLSRGGAVHGLVRRPQPTLSRGVQLLVDTQEALTPFFRDQAWLQKQVAQVVGAGRVSVLRFAGCPTRGAGPRASLSWSAYRPPTAETVVVLFTDLGIGRPSLQGERASPAEWRDFARQVRKAGCPIVAFVPYPPPRWPPGLSRHMTILQWDRVLTATMVRNVLGAAHRVAR